MGHSQSKKVFESCDKLMKGQLIRGEKNVYKIERILGGGKFGVTYLAHIESNPDTKVTIKCVEGAEKNEILVLKRLSDSSILNSLIDSIAIDGHTLIVSQYAEGFQLDEFEDKYPKKFEEQKGEILYYLLMALDELYSLGLLHNDIHTGNVIVDKEGFPRLIDYGQTCTFRGALADEGLSRCKINEKFIMKNDLCKLGLIIRNPHGFPLCDDPQRLKEMSKLLRYSKSKIDSEILSDMIDPDVYVSFSELLNKLEKII